MRLAVRRDPFDHPDWIYEVKYDGAKANVYPTGAGALLGELRWLPLCFYVVRSFMPFVRHSSFRTDLKGPRCQRLDFRDGSRILFDLSYLKLAQNGDMGPCGFRELFPK